MSRFLAGAMTGFSLTMLAIGGAALYGLNWRHHLDPLSWEPKR